MALGGARYLLAVLLVVSASRFAWEVKRSQDLCCADFPLYWAQVLEAESTGRLYPQAHDLDQFLPGSAVYKFPPFYAAVLRLWRLFGLGDGVFAFHAALQVALHLASALLVLLAWPRRSATAVALALLLTLNHGPFFETVWRLQAESWIAFLVALALLLASRGRDFAAGFLVGLAAMLKLYPAVLLAYFAATRRFSGIAGFALGAAAGLGAGLLAFAPEESGIYFGRLLPFMLQETAVEGFGTEGMGLPRYVLALLDTDPQTAKRIATGLVLLVTAATAWLAQRHAGAGSVPLGRALAFALFVPPTIQLMPNSWANYQLLLLLPLVALLGAGLARWPATAAPLSLAAVAAVLLAYHQQTHDFAGWPPERGAFFVAWQTLRGACPWLVWGAGAWLLASSPAPSAQAPAPGSAPSPAG